MIWDSEVWKSDLKRELSALERLVAKRGAKSEPLGIRIEKFYFLSAFIIRKLIEAGKLSSEVVSQKVKLDFHECIDKKVCIDRFNCHHIDRFYDLNAGVLVLKDMKWLCGKLIHSFSFSQLHDKDDKFIGVFFNSDENKKEGLWYLSFSEYKRIVVSCVDDNIIFSCFNREKSKEVRFSDKRNVEKWAKRTARES